MSQNFRASALLGATQLALPELPRATSGTPGSARSKNTKLPAPGRGWSRRLGRDWAVTGPYPQWALDQIVARAMAHRGWRIVHCASCVGRERPLNPFSLRARVALYNDLQQYREGR